MIDMVSEGQALNAEQITRLHALKTGRLIQVSAEAGAILGRAASAQRHLLAAYGRDLGAAFQIADDLLDATGTTEETGKTAGKDEAAGKATLVSVLGVERARAQAEALADQAAGTWKVSAPRPTCCETWPDTWFRRTEPLRVGYERPVAPTRILMPADADAGPCALPLGPAQFSAEQLKQMADELRAETVDAVSVTGGHLGAALGVVELTVAIHAMFDTPYDRLIWDVGHQCYPHKILTGRRDRIRTLRQGGGLSGFTKRVGERLRPVRRGARVDLDLGRAGHGGGARPEGGARPGR